MGRHDWWTTFVESEVHLDVKMMRQQAELVAAKMEERVYVVDGLVMIVVAGSLVPNHWLDPTRTSIVN